MKSYCIYFLLFLATCSLKAQELAAYEKPIEMSLYSEILKDTVSLEITIPKEQIHEIHTVYPVIYLLDRQLQSNYRYNLNTIDYLSSLNWMPKAVVVGITFPFKNRTSWTNPNATGGQADDLMLFIENDLHDELKEQYPIANFNLLIGHSRTAIFSSYALSKRPEFFNGAIASSVSNFDFGDDLQQEQFEIFLDKIASSSQLYYYYFSVGETTYGDLHESAVDTLNAYFISKKLPNNFQWQYFKYPVAHDVTPGVTVGRALSDIFKEYGRRIDLCFEIAKKSPNNVPWQDFMELYATLSSDLGFEIEPEELFYNSIASMYYNDYNGLYGDKHLHFCLEILLKALEKYPNSFDYHGWAGEIYITLKEFDTGEQYLNKAIELINQDSSVSETDRLNYLKEIEALKKPK